MIFYLKKYGPIVGIGIIIFSVIYFMQSKESLPENEEEVFDIISNDFIQENTQLDMEMIEEQIIVDIKGEVHKPGVYEVENNARVIDVITVAGGFTELAAENYLNLAERVYDEMVIYVPNIKDLSELDTHSLIQIESSSNSASSGTDGIRVNIATIEQLTQLNGIGPQKAQAIINYRDEHGPFKQVDDLLNVNGIGEKTLDNMREQIIIP